MNQATVVSSTADESKARFQGLRPSRLKDPLIETPVKVTPIRIYY
jgi:hypothetical protein